MKKTFLIFLFAVIAPAILIFFHFRKENNKADEVKELRQQHAAFLKHRPAKANTSLSRKDKLKQGLPPNEYYELMAYFTMNPALGYPEPYKVHALQKELAALRSQKQTKAPGEEEDTPWLERGPNNVGGRTRVLLFDPNDDSGQRVFAGAISGGLWVNENITSETSPWQRVTGLGANLNISCITVDPRDSNTWYAGTGEQYTAGDVVGTGVYKTTDGGNTWTKVLDVEDYATDSPGNEQQSVIGGIHYINDIVAWDNGTATEIFIGVTTHIYSNARNPTNFLGFFDRGLYQSTNGGATWDRIIENDSFNDFETDVSGNLWVATTNSPGAGEENFGGKIFRRILGEETTFSQVATVPNVMRTEIEASATNPEKFYILAESINNETEMWITTDAFSSIQTLPEPIDVDLDIPPDDFARGQAFYNLMIEADPTNDDIVYAGGINLFRSDNGGVSWQQISKWANNNNLEDLPVSLVHADHHVMQFRPGNTNQAIFGHDGGVSYARNLAAAGTSDVFITPEVDYITTQFYSVAVAPDFFSDGDYFLGGTQDNGTLLIEAGDPLSIGVLGGDGAHAFFDQVDTDYFVANLVYNNLIIAYDYSQQGMRFIADNEDNDGFFINPQALDSNLDKLFSNGPVGILYRYDNLDDLPESERGDDIVAPRESLSNDILDASISALTVSPYESNSSTVLAGLINGRLIRIEDADGNPGAANWEEITGSGFVGTISDVEFGDSEEEVLVTFYNYGVQSVWYTENALDEEPVWIRKEGNLPDLPVLAILKNPLNPEEVLVGTELGVWTTNDFLSESPTWNQAYNGMSDVKVTDLDLKKGENSVFAASYGRGIFSGQLTTEDGATERIPLEEDVLLVLPTISEGGSFRIVSGSDLGETRVDVFSSIGQRLETFQLDVSGNRSTELNLNHLRTGIYLVKLEGQTGSTTHKVIIR